MVFARESLRDVWDQVIALAEQHWMESEEYRHYQGFNPDIARYIHCEDVGMYHHFCARDNGRLVGSGGVYITPCMHTQRLIATEDTYYLLPEYRKGRNALRFFTFMENYLRDKGVVSVNLTTPLTNIRAERIVQHMGYGQIGKVWTKSLQLNSEQRVA